MTGYHLIVLRRHNNIWQLESIHTSKHAEGSEQLIKLTLSCLIKTINVNRALLLWYNDKLMVSTGWNE